MDSVTRKDFLVNFPSGIRGTIDLYRQATVIPATTDFVMIDFIMPPINFGVLKFYGFGFVSGDVTLISFKFLIAGMLYPQTFNTQYQGNIISPVYALDSMHHEVQSNTRIQFLVTNASAVIPAVVWVRTKGWYY